jgi:broad specificity phosphatase PhoE
MTRRLQVGHGIWLVRHAPTAWTGRRWCGRADPPITRDGRRLAVALATRLASELSAGTVVRSSPALRAVRTAEPIAARIGARVEIDPDLAEVDVGRAEGWTWDELTAREPETAAALLTGTVDWPEGEAATDVERRAESVAESIRGIGPKRSVVVVSHGWLLARVAAALGSAGATSGLEPCGVLRIAR